MMISNRRMKSRKAGSGTRYGVDFTRMVTSAMGTEYKEPEKHWSDKYIAAAQDMGIVNEFVIPDDPIPREVMMKYVVNALGVNGN